MKLTLPAGSVEDLGGGVVRVTLPGAASDPNTPTTDQKAALDAANAPDAGNAFATIDDLGGGGLTNPLAADLLTAGFPIRGAAVDGGSGGSIATHDAPGGIEGNGGGVTIVGGDGLEDTGLGGSAILTGGNATAGDGASFTASGGTTVGPGFAVVRTGGITGAAGEALLSSGGGDTVWGGLTANGTPPIDPPFGKLPIHIVDGTDLYLWNGAAWLGPWVLV